MITPQVRRRSAGNPPLGGLGCKGVRDDRSPSHPCGEPFGSAAADRSIKPLMLRPQGQTRTSQQGAPEG